VITKDPLLKRAFDIFLSLLGLTVFFPLGIIISLAIYLEDQWPIFFSLDLPGKDDNSFRCLKFRTMKHLAEGKHEMVFWENDPRVTKVGRFLREYSLDELPQLFNILKGDMSVVGPRPLYLTQMPEWNERQKRRLRVKPGLTGLAQIQGRGGLTREEKLELDVKYVETAGFLTDMKIILASVTRVFGRRGVYEKKYSQTEYTRGMGNDFHGE